MSDDLDDICDQLRSVSDRLADLALASLREAVGEGATRTPAEERRLTRARRAVDKAIAVLSEGGDLS
jgi:hypothetical protein